jgi:hypothetical protein
MEIWSNFIPGFNGYRKIGEAHRATNINGLTAAENIFFKFRLKPLPIFTTFIAAVYPGSDWPFQSLALASRGNLIITYLKKFFIIFFLHFWEGPH